MTVIPVRPRDDLTAGELASSRYAYPLVGGTIGLALAALSVGLDRATITPGPAAFLLILAGVLVSGGLHLDGLADSFDGLFLWGDPGRRLAVMRDPHVGSFGVSAIVLVLLGKYAALASLSGNDRALAILGAPTVSRTLILVSAGTAHYARREGTGRILIEATTLRDALGATVLAVTLGAALGGRIGLWASGVSLVLAWGLTRMAVKNLGGVTGDTLGALVELGEMTFLVTLGMSIS